MQLVDYLVQEGGCNVN